VADKNHKDWGKVLFISGIHHEKDRETIFTKYGKDIKLIAWETKTDYIFDAGFKFVHDCGHDILEKDKAVLMQLLEKWASTHDSYELFLRITDSNDAYYYCRYVKDRKEVRDKITDSYYAYLYCCFVKDRKEVRDKITNRI